MLSHAAHENNSLENFVFLPHWHKLQELGTNIKNEACVYWKNQFLPYYFVAVEVCDGWGLLLKKRTPPPHTDKHKVMTQASLDPVGLHVLISLRCGGHCVVLG